jgi:hypothetical protein
VSYLKQASFLLLTTVAFNFTLAANEEDSNTDDVNTEFSEISGQNDQSEPSTDGTVKPCIRTLYYSAEAVQALPRLKPLASQEPEYNKILFKLEGYPTNKEIILEIKRLASPDPKAYEKLLFFTIKDDGSMLISGTDQQIQTVIGNSRGFLPGERVFYRFRTIDGKVNNETSGIPTPAIVRNKDHKVVLNAELVSVNPTAYQITFPTMTNGEEYELKSISVGDIVRAKPKYNKDKPLIYAPAAKANSKGGDAILEIRRKSGPTYAIKLPWGCALEGYYSGKKIYSSKP